MTGQEQAALDALFEQLFLDLQRPIYNFLYRLVGEAGRAEELTQDVFIRAYKSLGRLPQGANHRAWVYRIATNAAHDLFRRRKLIQWVPLMDRDASQGSGAERHDKRIDDRDAVQRALVTLPAKYRIPLVLFAVEGYSVREVGEMMRISTGAVKTRLFRARERFRKAYSGDIDHAL